MTAVHRSRALSAGVATRATRRAARLAGIVLVLGLIVGRHLLVEGATPERPRPSGLKATTSRAARDDAVRSIPTEKLDAEARAKVASVLADANFFRRMPIHVIQCDPDLYLFLVRHPDVVANIWEVLKIARLTVRQTGPEEFQVADGEGTLGRIEYLYRSHDTHIIFTKGRYEGPLLKQLVRGQGLMILKTGYIREPDGRYYITSRLDSFTHLEPGGVEFLTKLLQPLVGKVADANFIQTGNFLGSLSRAAEADHRGVELVAARLLNVRPEVRKELAELAKQIAQKRAKLQANSPPSSSAVAAGAVLSRGQGTSPGPTP